MKKYFFCVFFWCSSDLIHVTWRDTCLCNVPEKPTGCRGELAIELWTIKLKCLPSCHWLVGERLHGFYVAQLGLNAKVRQMLFIKRNPGPVSKKDSHGTPSRTTEAKEHGSILGIWATPCHRWLSLSVSLLLSVLQQFRGVLELGL